MAKNRCFNTSNNTLQNASDYSIALKQKTIYSSVAQNMSLGGTANPQKTNGFLYNNNFGVVPLTSSASAGCLINSQSYDLLLNVTKGQSLYNADNGLPTNNQTLALNTNELWAGNLFSMNYSAKNVNVVVDTSYNGGNTNEIIFPQPISAHNADLSFNTSYPGVIVDPSYLLFYNPCLTSFNDGKNPWLPLVDIDFNDSNYYQTAVKNDPFYNFSYPQKVIFNCNKSSNNNINNRIIVGYYGILIDEKTENLIGGYWKNNSWTTLPLPQPNNIQSYRAYGISSDNTIVGSYNNTQADIGGYWNANNDWNTLPNPNNDTTSFNYNALGISSDSTIIVGVYTDNLKSNQKAGYWTNNSNVWTWTLLPSPTNGTINYGASSISYDKTIIVGVYTNINQSIGGYWTLSNNTWTSLPSPNNIYNYNASGITSNSIIVGSYVDNNGNQFGGYWTNNNNVWNWTSLSKPPYNIINNYTANNISIDGTIIIGSNYFLQQAISGYWINNFWTDLPKPINTTTAYYAFGII